MPVLSLACHLPHNTPHIPSRYNNEQTTKQTKAINNSYIYINISCKCDTNRAGHFTLDAYASRPVACWVLLLELIQFTNPRIHVFHIPLFSIQNINVHIFVLKGALCHMEQAHSGICEIGRLPNVAQKKIARDFILASFRRTLLWSVWGPYLPEAKVYLIRI